MAVFSCVLALLFIFKYYYCLKYLLFYFIIIIGSDDEGVRVINNYQISYHQNLCYKHDDKLVVSDYENIYRMSAKEN